MANSMFKFTLPAQAMRFADDNIRVGKQSTAKDALQWFMGQRRLNKQFTPDHEALAIKFVDLAVDLKDAYSSKDGLINFRYLTQQHNPAALDRVVRRLITRALSKARDARDAAAGSVDLAAVDDLDAEQTPEELLMSSMTSEGAAERAQRELVVPWVRHAWDVCKNTLDTLRNIPKLEEAYQYAAFQAFDFCAEFGRTTEFRKLCESMRKHLNHWRNDFQKWDMSEADPRFTLDNLERHMSTRFTQLSHCANLSMWSEGFRTVEDIFALVRLAPEEPAPALMAQYYDNLAKIFWKSDDLLFHAYATLQHFRVLAAQKGVATVASGTGAATGAGTGGSTPPEVTHLANQLVCAALCIPLFADAHSEDERFFHMDFDRDKKDRLARLLNFAETPSRDALLAKLGHLGVARLASPEVGALLNNLEGAFHPLEMVASVQPALATATSTPALVEYVPALEKLVLYRLLGQLTQVYSFITMDFFDGLVAPLKLSGEALELEIARGCKAMLLQVRLDHCGRCIRLGRESMESDRMRSQLTSLATALADIVPSLPADSGRAGMADLLATKRDQVFKHAKESEDGTLEENLGRIKEIEARREKQAREAEVKRRLAEAEAAAAAARQAEHEAARVAAEKRRREAEKTKLIEEEMHLAEMRSMLKDMGQDPAAKTRAELLALTADQLEAEAYAKETSAAKAAEDRRFKRSQELTFLTRALREREQDEMIAWVDARLDTDGEYATKQQELVRARSEKLHAETLIVKARLARMMPFLDTFEENVLSARQTQHALALEERLAKARAAALQGKVERAMRAKVAKETADEMEREAERQRRVADAERKRREEDARAAAAADAERFAKVRDRVESQLEAGGSKPAFGQQRADADMDFGKFRSGGPSTAAVPPPSGNLRGGHSSSWTPSAPSTREAGRGGWGSGARTGGAFGSKDQDVRASGGGFGSGSGSGGFGSRGPPRSSGGFRRDEDRKPSGGGGDGGGWRR